MNHTKPTRRTTLLASAFLLFFSTYLFYACKKDEAGSALKEKEAVGSVKPKAPDATAKYPGPCPYPCGDSRCVGYSEPSPDCDEGGGGTTTDTIMLVTNPNNPKEEVGKSHNNGMRDIMPHYENGALQPTQQNVHDYTRSFMSTAGYDLTTFENTYNWTVQNGYYNFNQSLPIDSAAAKAYREGYISTTGKSYINRLSSLISSLDGTTAPTSDTYMAFANQVVSYENEIAGNYSLGSIEKDMLLSIHAVARYSANYWMNYSNKQSTTIAAARASSWFNWKDCVGDDVSGGIGGAIGGALAGSMAGGVGAGPGAVVGGVSGAVGTSVTNAAKQIWNHFVSW